MATQYPEARVLIIMTGGTICMRHSPAGLVPARGFLKEGMAPRPSFNDGSNPDPLPVMTSDNTQEYLPSLRTPPSTYSRHVRYTLHEFPILLDSSSISSAGWTQIALTIKRNYSLFDGFVVLHGTDSLAYSSSALSFMLSHLGKPVILTGSQASIFALQSDATDNLLGSLIIAGTFMIPEVCLFFHHRLYRGNRCTKVSATSFDAFASPNCEPLAKSSALGAEVNWTLIRRPRTIARFDVQTNLDTAHVACLRIFPGIKPEMLDSVLHVPNLRGLILETFGAGNAPTGEDGSMTRVIKSAVSRGIVIVNVSQCQSGFVSPLYAPGAALGQAGVVFGHDLTTEAALTKLSYLLALPGLSYEDITTQMQLSIRGEMTEESFTSFSHPGSDVPVIANHQTAFTALGHAITKGDVETVVSLLDADSHGLLNAKDYAENTALHLAAVGPDSKVLRELLKRGASVHVRNLAGNTPLYLAVKVGNTEIVRLLEESGALLHVEELERVRRLGSVDGHISTDIEGNGGAELSPTDTRSSWLGSRNGDGRAGDHANGLQNGHLSDTANGNGHGHVVTPPNGTVGSHVDGSSDI
ncbi:60 kDa lysophospholipase-like protein [Mollisia scopiformis]|uniref:asparaginase n=1 Tax=Mollisia scopiformis TaxID=149040 RepID=A0A132B4V7_MOLSC|nr:60 kDa lysophospholipase-like protein [Mollisia scopiformis]KUJ06707.1 60 kDa lysophospholipase-like protein [Mollisia scopiformis]